MTFNEFQKLSDNEKADYLWDKGSPVSSHNREQAKFILYQLDDFYVEVEYKTDFMEIVMLKAFEISNLPEFYLDRVNISGLRH
jgi:hypothetical protein